MHKAVYRLVRRTPPAVVCVIFVMLLVLAIAPAFRVVLFGLSVDEILQLRCLTPA